MGAGLLLSIPAAGLICRMTVTTTGLLIPSALPIGICLGAIGINSSPAAGLRLVPHRKDPPDFSRERDPGNLEEIPGKQKDSFPHPKERPYLLARPAAASQRQAPLHRGLSGGVLLVFFASLIGRVNAWLGPNGEGLMDAFNPADLHIAAQPMGETTIDRGGADHWELYAITDSYDLAMPSVSVNGVDMTANVITEPERFHLLSGQTCRRQMKSC